MSNEPTCIPENVQAVLACYEKIDEQYRRVLASCIGEPKIQHIQQEMDRISQAYEKIPVLTDVLPVAVAQHCFERVQALEILRVSVMKRLATVTGQLVSDASAVQKHKSALRAYGQVHAPEPQDPRFHDRRH